MKKLIFLTILTFFGINGLFAQISFQGKSSLGISAIYITHAVIDYNNDTFEDFITSDTITKKLVVYKNNQNSTYSRVSVGVSPVLWDSKRSRSTMINPADFNNDGYCDFVLTYSDSIKFFKNNGNNTFSDITSSLGISNPLTNRTIEFRSGENGYEANGGYWDDYDNDGDLDYIVGSIDASNTYIEVFVNNGTSFSARNILLTFPVTTTPYFVLLDYDNDQDQDLMVLNFANTNPPLSQYNYFPVLLFQKNGLSYTDVTTSSGLGLGSNHGFAKIWDYNNDGFVDIIMGTTNSVFNSTHTNRVYKNNGNGTFADVSTTLNLKSDNGYYRYVYLEDFDNDNDLDVFYNSISHLYQNNGNSTFGSNIISNSGLSSTNASFFIDCNNDGKLDCIWYNGKANINASSNNNNYIKIKLTGPNKLKDPRGSRVCVYYNTNKLTKYYTGGIVDARGGIAPYSQILHFGIGATTSVDSIKVYWANGGSSVIKNVTINSLIQIGNQTAGSIPSYIPSNGLVGYWPFNGNANDESGNGNNGTVNGATLSTDRFGINSAAYSFNGTSNYIEVQHNSSQLLSNKVSFSLWIFPLDYSTFNNQTRAPLGKRRTSTTSGIGFETVDGVGSCCGPQFYVNNNTSSGGLDYESSISLPNNSWTHLVGTYDGVVLKLYQNSVLLGTASGTINLSTTIQNLFFGREGSNTPQNYFKGIIDDIGFWNRALTQKEITSLYNGNICFETVRVTDTLVINVNRTGYNPITYSNTIKVYPNPANNKITIDNGDIQKMNGYSIKIINSLGQQVYQGAITQQIVSIDITQWAGNGMYYLQLTDNNGNIVDVKKIVLQ